MKLERGRRFQNSKNGWVINNGEGLLINFIVYGKNHHSLTRKTGFMAISYFMIDWLWPLKS